MTNKPEYVQLETGDDVASVRDRLSFIRGRQVLLIWPEEGTALTRKLDLVLIQREARRRAIRLALVTHDADVIRNAEELSISTFETIGASERGRWKRGRTKVFIQRFHRPKNDPDPDALMDVASRVRNDRAVSQLRAFLVRGGVLGMLALAVLAVGYIVIPGAKVSFTLAQETVSADATIIADPNVREVNVDQGIIPATIIQIEIEQTGTVPTTGTAQATDVLATGTVVFINQTTNEVNIPAGTTVSTSAGTPILFHTTDDVTVPAGVGEQIEVGVEARGSFAGDIGNVDSGMINTVIGPLENMVTVRNLSPTFGGETRTLPAVTEEDQQRLLATVRQQLQAQAYTEMDSQPRRDTQFIVLETLHISEERSDWTNYSAQPGDIASSLSLTMRAVVEAVMVDEAFGQQVTRARMNIPRGRIIINQPTYTRGPIENYDENGQVTFTMSGTATVAGQVNTGLLQERLAGRTLDDALTYLFTEVDLAPGSQPEITISPAWYGRMPVLPVRIEINMSTGQ